MRWPRAGIFVAVLGFVLLVAGWGLTSIGSAGPLHDAGRSQWRVATSPALMQQLQQYLARSASPAPPRRPRLVPSPRPGLVPQGSTCFVAGGRVCSIQACVVPIAAGLPAPACTAAPAPVRAVPVSRP